MPRLHDGSFLYRIMVVIYCIFGAACRAGVGHLTIVDGDVVDITNVNRQLVALQSGVGRPKAHVMAERLRDINPDLDLVVKQVGWCGRYGLDWC